MNERPATECYSKKVQSFGTDFCISHRPITILLFFFPRAAKVGKAWSPTVYRFDVETANVSNDHSHALCYSTNRGGRREKVQSFGTDFCISHRPITILFFFPRAAKVGKAWSPTVYRFDVETANVSNDHSHALYYSTGTGGRREKVQSFGTDFCISHRPISILLFFFLRDILRHSCSLVSNSCNAVT